MRTLARKTVARIAALSLFAGFGATSANIANAQNYDLDDIVQVTLLTGWRMASGNHMAAVQIVLAPGWYTYWRQPGDTGIPPQFNWTASNNLTDARVHWPTPQVIELGSGSSLGYYDEIVWPLELSRAAPGPATLSGELQIGVCSEVCIPATFALSMELPQKGAQDPRIVESLKARPRAARGQLGCAVAPISDGLSIAVRLPRAEGADVRRVVIETSDPAVWVSRPEQRIEGGYWYGEAEMVPPDAKPFALVRDQVRVTLFGSGAVREYVGCAGY